MPGVPVKEFKRVVQLDGWSCGARSVQMILEHYGKRCEYRRLTQLLGTDPDSGTPVNNMLSVFRRFELKVSRKTNMLFPELKKDVAAGRVLLVHLDGDHFGVVHGYDDTHVYLADPSVLRAPFRTTSKAAFLKRWTRWALSVRE